MPTEKPFKVLIAGGGIAGLALAHMLEKFHIDYLLLESHSEIDPTLGASIGIGPHGSRILDQLDLYEPIAELDYKDKRGNHIHKENGDCLLNVSRFNHHLEYRHGYPIIFIDRQLFLRVLYDRLRYKNCVLLNKKVDRVELLESGVEVITTDGQIVRGSLIIGADGVHSAVRREMYRIASEQAPEYFAADEQEPVSCHYICNFGIAQNVAGWIHGHTYTTVGKGYSQLVVSGPGNRIYWFFFERLPETKYGKDVPRCIREMEAEFIKKHKHAPITKTVTFGQIYAKRLFTTLTPLHEYVHEKWFFDRIFMMGDSAHKLNPISGQGGNAAIESAADFVNILLKKKYSRTEGLSGMTSKDIAAIFTEAQASRYERAEQIVAYAHLQQSLTAYEKPLISKLTWEYLMPSKGPYGLIDMFSDQFIDSARLKYLSVKKRARVLPYADELPSSPLKRVRLIQIVFTLWMVYSAFMAYELSQSQKPRTDGLATQNNRFLSLSMQSNPENRVLQNYYFLSNLISPILIYIIEGYRLGTRNTILALPSLFLLAIGFKGIALISPIYAALSVFWSTPLPTRRFVKLGVAHALIPALILGYVLPTALILSGTLDIAKWATWAPRVYKFAPVFVGGLAFFFAYLGQIWNSRYQTPKDQEQSEFECYKAQDVPTLKSAYLFAFFLQAMVHITLLAFAYNELRTVAFQSYWNSNHKTIHQAIDLFWSDPEIAFATWLISNIYSIWDLRCFGYIKTRDCIIGALNVVAGQLLVGPGATWAALWYWREGVIVDLQRN
ncbi:hypothetical protein EYB26_006094 [Talaromyces marneffei]|uniref:FAD-dependent urate hydroxylase n=1 Tax=Talaromyces marneffei PM1 TaxID=1077442 RepID=A0A093V7Z2_TALMA|nr:uncharacterized protein EYB26_006094 [Talaromyces marneffei]QGA18409.1 hypothetical protein EYB26_006094 [Talaromyces marneffei]